MIRVLIADEQPVVRLGLTRLLEGHDITVADTTEDVRSTLRAATNPSWHVLIASDTLPVGGGLEAHRHISAMHPHLGCVIFAAGAEEVHGARALRSGVSAFVSKTRSVDELATAIRRAARGQRYVTDSVAAQLLESGGHTTEDPLTDREFQILALIGRGLRMRDISRSLAISPSTVSSHVGNLKRKLGARSTGELVRLAVHRGVS